MAEPVDTTPANEASDRTNTAPLAPTEASDLDEHIDLSGVAAPQDDAPECARDVYQGERADVALYLVVDVSGSMRAPVDNTTPSGQTGATVWDGVSQALIDFINSPSTTGFNVALNTYPIKTEARICHDDNDCGYRLGNITYLSTCITEVCESRFYQHGVLKGCAQDADCGTGPCGTPGHCENEPARICKADSQCQDGGRCNPDTGHGTCAVFMECELEPYSTPLLPRSRLPEAAPLATELLRAATPDGQGVTPTHLALTTAYDDVLSWRAENPAEESAVVLVTDGAPDGCGTTVVLPDEASTALAQTLGALAKASQLGIQTYVIGLAPAGSDTVQTLQMMAQAGGTESAFLVDPNAQAATGLGASLTQIRGQLPCEFELPTPREGHLDPTLVNLELVGPNQTAVIGRVPDRASCELARGGWYYRLTPSGAEEAVELCPSECEQVRAAVDSRVEIVLGCPQVITIQ